MGIFNAINAFVFPYLVARLTALFRKEKRFVLGTPLFAIASLGSASWILWPVVLVRALFGEVRGSAEIARVVHDISIDGNRVIEFLTPYGLWMVNLVDKFFVITAFNFVLNLFLLCFVTIASVDRRARFDFRAIIMAFCASSERFFFTSLSACRSSRRPPDRDSSAPRASLSVREPGRISRRFIRSRFRAPPLRPPRPRFPTSCRLWGRAAGEASAAGFLHLGIRNMLTIAAPLVILYPFSRAAFRELRAPESGAHRILAMWLVGARRDEPVHRPSREQRVEARVSRLSAPHAARRVADHRGAAPRAGGEARVRSGLVVVVLFAVPPVLTVRGFFLEKPVNPIERGA